MAGVSRYLIRSEVRSERVSSAAPWHASSVLPIRHRGAAKSLVGRCSFLSLWLGFPGILFDRKSTGTQALFRGQTAAPDGKCNPLNFDFYIVDATRHVGNGFADRFC